MRRWLRPSLEIVGVGGGHTGEGMRGVVPSKAKAKVMCRLVADQNATAVLEALQRHVSMHAPSHAHINFRAAAQQGRLVTEPYRMPKDSLGNRAAAKASPFPSQRRCLHNAKALTAPNKAVITSLLTLRHSVSTTVPNMILPYLVCVRLEIGVKL